MAASAGRARCRSLRRSAPRPSEQRCPEAYCNRALETAPSRLPTRQLLARPDRRSPLLRSERARRESRIASALSVLAFSHHAGLRVAEVAFLFLLIAGIWIAVASGFPASRWQRLRMIVAGVLVAGAGLLLIVAAHFGHLFR